MSYPIIPTMPQSMGRYHEHLDSFQRCLEVAEVMLRQMRDEFPKPLHRLDATIAMERLFLLRHEIQKLKLDVTEKAMEAANAA